MNTHTAKIQDDKTQSVADHLTKQESNGASAFQFEDNRPNALAQRKLQAAINNGPRMQQLRAAQDMVNNRQQVQQVKQLQAIAAHEHQPIQRRGFADPANPNITRQWEGKGYISRDQREERPAALAALVDQFKKEILTYIAHYIRTNGAGHYGPHIAVIITGDNWNISVNSNVSVANQALLQADGEAAKAHVDACWDSLDNTYGEFFTTKTWFENDAVEAAYITFRWAAGKSTVRAIANAGPAANRRVHGEMRIIDTLKAEAPDLHTPALPGSVHPVVPLAAAAPLPAGARRVVRVGGTKTPCFDCAWEMDKVPTHGQAAANVSTEAPGAHHATHDAHMIGAGENERVATTMSPTFGPSFPTWQSTDATRGRRAAPIALAATPHFEADQEQNYDALRAAYVASGCTPAMV